MTITTASDLATRLNVERETLAIASQQAGGIKEYLRRYILEHGLSRIVGRGANGKGVETAEDCWVRLFGEKLEPKARGKK